MNRNLWELYKASDKGKALIDLFNPESENIFDNACKIVELTQEAVGGDDINFGLLLGAFSVNITSSPHLPEEGEAWDRDRFSTFIKELDIKSYDFTPEGELQLYDNEIIIKKTALREKAAQVMPLSFVLYSEYDFFKPVLWRSRFDVLQKSCDALGIEMPDIPHTNDYMEYLMLYYDICEAWNEFQVKYDLTDAELCACIYGFGPMCAVEREVEELPRPTNVWITGASGKGDFEFLDKLGQNTEYNKGQIWACNERTRRGDIVVLYCTSPRSYIHSIWRANSGGIFNPFDFYHCRTTVCEGRLIPQISHKELKNNDYFKEIPIVRKNLQGANGVELSAKDYAELLRLIEEKGGDILSLPKLFDDRAVDFGEIKLEKDVEEHILIPFLNKLGYTEDDWDRQLSQKAGRGLKAIPDFVFFPRGEKHFASAPMVIEAKLDMSVITEQLKAFKQGLSYARLLRSKYMGICDKERLIIYHVDENGYADRNCPLFENHWQTIMSDAVVGAKLNQLIGREVISTL